MFWSPNILLAKIQKNLPPKDFHQCVYSPTYFFWTIHVLGVHSFYSKVLKQYLDGYFLKNNKVDAPSRPVKLIDLR